MVKLNWLINWGWKPFYKQTLKQWFYIGFSTSSNITEENSELLQDDDDDDDFSLIEEDENDSVLEEPQPSSTSKPLSKPTSNAIAPQSIGKRRKPRDALSEQIMNYLEKKEQR